MTMTFTSDPTCFGPGMDEGASWISALAVVIRSGCLTERAGIPVASAVAGSVAMATPSMGFASKLPPPSAAVRARVLAKMRCRISFTGVAVAVAIDTGVVTNSVALAFSRIASPSTTGSTTFCFWAMAVLPTMPPVAESSLTIAFSLS